MNYNQIEIVSRDHYVFDQRRHQLFNRCAQEVRSRGLNCVLGIPDPTKIDRLGERTVFAQPFDLGCRASVLSNMDQVLARTGRQIYIITDNTGQLPDFKNIQVFQRPELMGVYASIDDRALEIKTPTRLFNCFMQRVDSVRQTWFYFLHHHDLIDQGYVSFLLKQLTDYSTLTGTRLFDHIHQRHQLHQLPHFEAAYLAWRNQVPFTNFEEQLDLPALYCDSRYSVILETFASEDEHELIMFSEKAIRALQMSTIPLLFVQKNGVQRLQQLGFEVGDHHWSFDHLPWPQRQQQILNVLLEKTVAYDRHMLYNHVMHNRELVKSFAERCARPDFFSEILDQL